MVCLFSMGFVEAQNVASSPAYIKTLTSQWTGERFSKIIYPDTANSWCLLETKRIRDYAHEHGFAMVMHQAGTLIAFIANVHYAVATENVLVLEHYGIDIPY